MNIPAKTIVAGVLRSHKSLLFELLATSLGRTAFVMASVLLIREFLFAVLEKQEGLAGTLAGRAGGEAALWLVGALLVASYVGSGLLAYGNQVARQRLVKVVELALLEHLIRHLLRLSVRFFDRTSHGDLIQAVRQDVAALRIIFMSGATVLMDGAVAAGLVVAAAWISPRLAFWALLVLPVAALPMVAIARRTRARSFAERKSGYLVFNVILQILRGIRIIKAYQGEEQEARASIDEARRFFDEQIRIVRIRELSTVLLESLAGVSIAAVVIIGGLQVMHGTLDWPQLLAFLMAVRMLHGPLDHVNVHLMEIQRHGAAADRISALLAERPEIQDVPGARPIEMAPRRIALDGVTFDYGDGPVLDGLSLEVSAGETIGIAGPSGSGKTTLLGLVARFYDPIAGAVRFDGVDLRDLRLQDVCHQVAIVTQEPFLFETSVRENIRSGRPEATDAEVEEAARVAEIHDEVLALPLGYETVLGVGGRGLSGGQAQRINVARAILKNAPILLLDEATSSLDSIAEAKVQRAIDHLMAGRTTFIVAHRLSTLRGADRILVLDRGRVVGLGSHEKLLASCALYRSLWETQQLGSPARETAEPLGEIEGEAFADDEMLA
jgi:ABC-type multidrug transport system fused ATPase/permease subunit